MWKNKKETVGEEVHRYFRVLGKAVRKERRAQEMAQTELARRVGVTVPTVRAVEKGEIGVASWVYPAALVSLGFELQSMLKGEF